jgi:hypothetical protein
MAQGFQPFDEAPFNSLPVSLIEGGRPEIFVGALRMSEQVVDHDEDGVGDGHRRAFGSASQSESTSNSPVIVPKVRLTLVGAPAGPGTIRHATTVRLWTSSPQHRA